MKVTSIQQRFILYFLLLTNFEILSMLIYLLNPSFVILITLTLVLDFQFFCSIYFFHQEKSFISISLLIVFSFMNFQIKITYYLIKALPSVFQANFVEIFMSIY
jgi:hypothetical protein